MIKVEAGRVIIANQLQVTRKPGLSSIEITNRTVLALEQVAKTWGLPAPRFYWVPSVKLDFQPEERALGSLIEKALENAGAALEE